MKVDGNLALVSLPLFERFGDAPYVVKRRSKLVFRNCPMLTTLNTKMFLDHECSVYIVNTGIGREEFLRIVARLPFITWHVGPETLSFDTFKDLREAVTFWAQHLSDEEGANVEAAANLVTNLVPDLERVVQGYYVRGLLSFLSKLRISKQFEYKEMRQGLAVRVVELLETICGNEPAREELLVRITDSVDSCGDKPVLVLNHCQMQILVSQAKNNPAELLRLGLSLMRLGIVHEHALAKIKTLSEKDRDDVCVYLRFEIELSEALDLPIASQKMLFPSFVQVKDHEFKAAKRDALLVQQNSDAFQEWLKTWGPWQEHLRNQGVGALGWGDLPTIQVKDADPDDFFNFAGDPMSEPVMLLASDSGLRSGPYELSELVQRFVSYGMDFNNVSWQPDQFAEALRRVDVGNEGDNQNSNDDEEDDDEELDAGDRGEESSVDNNEE
jgi:hypothetical protein